MSDGSRQETVFFTCVGSAPQAVRARLLLDSIRSFGGELSECPFWVLKADSEPASCKALEEAGADVVPFEAHDSLGDYVFARKVTACARAEERASGSAGTLVWLIPECLILRPPTLFRLDASADVAVRPVHIRNVGSLHEECPDSFWSGVYAAVGEPDASFTVESFIEGERIRPYFNSAALSFTPELGLMAKWLGHFAAMVADSDFQSESCADELHRIFLHQAILSTLIATAIDRTRIRELPPDYGYPYNLHGSVPEDRRVPSLNETVCPIYEERPVDPRVVEDIRIDEPLRSWLMKRVSEEEV